MFPRRAGAKMLPGNDNRVRAAFNAMLFITLFRGEDALTFV